MKFVTPEQASAETVWDVVIIGSGFGSLFFLKRYLQKRPNDRILILERGRYNSSEWQLENRANSDIPPEQTYEHGEGSGKPWDFTIGLGGSTNCWWGLTPRMHPSDFKVGTQTGLGSDWPIDYDDLVPYWQELERIMLIAGSSEIGRVYPGTEEYPQPAHQLTSADEIMVQKGNGNHFPMPTAKLSRSVGARGRCCSSAKCNLCPVGAKFTAFNAMDETLSHPSVSIGIGCEVTHLDVEGGNVSAVHFKNAGREYSADCDLCVLGANAIHSPFIFQRSGIAGHGVGRYLGEKMLADVEVLLGGLDHFDGGTDSTAINLSIVEEGRSAEFANSIYLVKNNLMHGFRLEPGRWRQTLPITLYVEDVFDYENGVFDDGSDKPVVRFKDWSDYAMAGLDHAISRIPEIFSPLPIEGVRFLGIKPTLGHIQGSLRMGSSIEDSVVDAGMISHAVRNLCVVGTSIFPTPASANPTLSAAALSYRAVDQMLG
ncbi:GMC oxidoreductase [Erythrobacter ani]|uniref:GMC family oxidoreductase n=1 Tax=Erythrobacter ani TaxID=2827235 RepID=A0ABS6SMR0_9SPHN|nr:GMC family oxidoreductase [Erythrobacter ani]MBV7266296.1 GMC family oxidoreductase [Erythrobacter ani]